VVESIGVIAIDDANGSPVDHVLELTNGPDTDRGCECVGYRTTGKGIRTRTWRSTSSPARTSTHEDGCTKVVASRPDEQGAPR
jgi:hypothetical protein